MTGDEPKMSAAAYFAQGIAGLENQLIEERSRENREDKDKGRELAIMMHLAALRTASEWAVPNEDQALRTLIDFIAAGFAEFLVSFATSVQAQQSLLIPMETYYWGLLETMDNKLYERQTAFEIFRQMEPGDPGISDDSKN